ncbi:MAG: rhodanese-like domain-containing protein, partial [Candidatus Hydrothermarchaeales archaeon]
TQTKAFHIPQTIMKIDAAKDKRRRVCVDCHGPLGPPWSADEQLTELTDISYDSSVGENGVFAFPNKVPHSIHKRKLDANIMKCETCHVVNGEFIIPQADATKGQVLVCQNCKFHPEEGNYVTIHVEMGGLKCTVCHTGGIINVHKAKTADLGQVPAEYLKQLEEMKPKETEMPVEVVETTPPPATTAPPITEIPVVPGYANPDALVDFAWLKEHIDDENLHIIDLSSDKTGYEIRHIPGAIYVDVSQDIVDLDNPVANQVAPKEKIEALVQRLGINEDDTIVVYDDTNNMKAARMFYVLRYYGHKDIRLLNGGLNEWTDNGGETTSAVPEVTPTEYSLKEPNMDMITDLAFVNENIDNPNITLVDARPTVQYTGEDVRPGIGRGGGHIPGAINVPGGLTWDEDMKIISFEELQSIYQDAGVMEDKKIVTYCHNGNLGAYTWFVLNELLGYPDVVLYDGSMLEWSNNPDVTIVTGSKPRGM